MIESARDGAPAEVRAAISVGMTATAITLVVQLGERDLLTGNVRAFLSVLFDIHPGAMSSILVCFLDTAISVCGGALAVGRLRPTPARGPRRDCFAALAVDLVVGLGILSALRRLLAPTLLRCSPVDAQAWSVVSP